MVVKPNFVRDRQRLEEQIHQQAERARDKASRQDQLEGGDAERARTGRRDSPLSGPGRSCQQKPFRCIEVFETFVGLEDFDELSRLLLLAQCHQSVPLLNFLR